jgi:hypothetical protein
VSQQQVPQQPKGSFLRAIKAVLWSFIGLRSRSEFNKDAAQLNPIHLIAVGLALGLLFVLGLLALVNWVVSQPVTL